MIVSRFARDRGLATSTLERFVETESDYNVNDAALSSANVTFLIRNYRSHPDIIDLPNKLFYNGRLLACADPVVSNRFLSSREDSHGEAKISWKTQAKDMPLRLPSKNFPFIFHALEGADVREGNSPSWFNVEEVKQVRRYVEQLRALKSNRPTDDEIGIISPYSKQVQKIRAMLGQNMRIKCGSVEEFQGQERQVIIISTVRSSVDLIEFDLKYRLGFLSSPKRFNVAITRAKALVIIVGNPRVLCQDPNWRHLLRFIHERGGCTGSPMPEDLLRVDEGGDSGTSGPAATSLDDTVSKLMRLFVSPPMDGNMAVEEDAAAAAESTAGFGGRDWLLSDIEGGGLRRLD